MRLRARVDRNHEEIMHDLRDVGCTVQSLAALGRGCPDLLVGFRQRNYLFEVKDGLLAPSRRLLTLDERCWHEAWCGQVDTVENLVQVLRVLQR